MKWSIGHKLGAGFGLALLSLAVMGPLSHRVTTHLIETARRVEETRGILGRLDAVLYQMKDAEAGMAIYLITSQERSLAPYHAATTGLARQLSDLRKLTADRPGQQARLDALGRLIEQKVTFMGELLNLHRNANAAAAQALRTSRAERLTNDIRKAIVEIQDHENDLLKRREQEAATAQAQAVLIDTYGTFLALPLVALAAFFVTRSIILPVRKLLDEAAGTGSQAPTRKIHRRADGETSELAAPFNEIADQFHALRAETDLLRSILENIGDGVIVAEGDGALLLSNPAARQVLGSAASVTSVTEWARRCGCYQADKTTPYRSGELPLSRALRGEVVNRQEMFVRYPEAAQGRWLSITARPLNDQKGLLWGSVTILSDITQRREAETALRDSTQLLRMILETLPVAVWVTNTEGRIIMKNKTADQTWPGSTHAGVDQYGEYSGWWPETGEPVQPHEWALARALFRGEPSIGEVIDIICRDGTRKTIWDSAVPIRDSNRQIVGAIVVHEDITELKREEEKVRTLNQELQRRATELEALNRELEAFSYSVSHDLRAPLRAISGFSEALLEDYADRLDAEGKDFLQRVCAATRRMALLIDHLLNLSRVTRSEMRCAKVDLSALAQTVADELQKAQPERRVEFVVAPGLVANADPHLLQIVFENLLGNAWKFTRTRAQARIEVGVREQEGEKIFFVRDDGVGFDMAYAGKLFGAFQRLHGDAEFEGSGIGLATVQRIIHRHGGRVSAEGVVGRGATFFFTLS